MHTHEPLVDGTAWAKRLAPFSKANRLRAWYELAVSIGGFVGLWILMWLSLPHSLILTFLLALLAAGFLVRIFIIQHDCGHGSFFESKRLNDYVGRLLGVLTFTPYDYWRRMHATHHAVSGDLGKRGTGDIYTLTVDEYYAKSWVGRLYYRVYRNPLVLFVFGPSYLFLLEQRLPFGYLGKNRKMWMSTMGTNAGILLMAIVVASMVGWKTLLMIQLPTVALAASIGVWMFYVQHQFEDTSWDKKPDWTHAHLALHGSSYYKLPEPLMWLTGYIGIYHVHHLSSRIPFYHLPDVLRTYPELRDIGKLTLMESLRCVRLVLWDPVQRKLISFAHARDVYSNSAGTAT